MSGTSERTCITKSKALVAMVLIGAVGFCHTRWFYADEIYERLGRNIGRLLYIAVIDDHYFIIFFIQRQKY